MPIYTCVSTTKTLADDTKAAVAAEITKIHSSITGAPSALVHVVVDRFPADPADGDGTREPLDGHAPAVSLTAV
jgi:phenylpyruvate tautomerase PptA (4-oxalocrotonate tautomerase family)